MCLIRNGKESNIIFLVQIEYNELVKDMLQWMWSDRITVQITPWPTARHDPKVNRSFPAKITDRKSPLGKLRSVEWARKGLITLPRVEKWVTWVMPLKGKMRQQCINVCLTNVHDQHLMQGVGVKITYSASAFRHFYFFFIICSYPFPN